MTPNNNLSVLPFYPDEKYQDFRKSYAYGEIYPLFSPSNRLLPFQIIRPTSSVWNPTAVIRRVNKNGLIGSEFRNVTQTLLEGGLRLNRFSTLGYDVISYPGVFPFPNDIEEGQFYLGFHDGKDRYTSDVFTVVHGIENYMKIEWWDIDNITFDDGAIDYGSPFKNVLYLCAEIGKPEYIFEEEGEDRDGFFFPEKQLSEKRYKFQFLAPEYLCDAMRVIRMADYVRITANGQTYNCDTFLITVKWQTQGNLASVEAEFECDTVIKKIGRGIVPSNLGDFNNDFNNDFDNQ